MDRRPYIETAENRFGLWNGLLDRSRISCHVSGEKQERPRCPPSNDSVSYDTALNKVVVPIGASVLIVSAIEPAECKQIAYRSFVRANLRSLSGGLTSNRCCESILFVLCDF